MTILTRNHESFYELLLAGRAPESRLVQPCNRGAAPAILHGLIKLAERTPAAVIALFPLDHYVSERRTSQ